MVLLFLLKHTKKKESNTYMFCFKSASVLELYDCHWHYDLTGTKEREQKKFEMNKAVEI